MAADLSTDAGAAPDSGPPPCPPGPRPGPLRRALRLLALIPQVLVMTPIGALFGRRLVVLDPLAKADYILVLGGDILRLFEGVRLYKEGWAGKIIISANPWEIGPFAKAARLCGVPADDVILDGVPLRTADHPETIAALPTVERDRHRFIVVTLAVHTYRARGCLRRGGYRHLCMRAPIWETDNESPPSWVSRAYDVQRRAHEVAGVIYYKLRGWM